MEFRPALPPDYRGILDLAEAYHTRNLSPAERRQGFLTARLSLGQIASMAEDLGIVIACEADRVAAFMCASRFDWPETPPIIRAMSAVFDRVAFHGRPLATQRAYLYGPVCIDHPFRGKGLLRALFQRLNQSLAGDYEVGVAFISGENPHSLEAHALGLGMEVVGEFSHDGQSYHILAYRP